MKVLFTGGSSFTGMWFANELMSQGHAVSCIFRKPVDAYDGLRGARVKQVCHGATAIEEVSFGDDRFLQVIRDQGPWDLVCHHGADVTNYKSPDFDPITATRNNCFNLPNVLEAMTQSGCKRLLLTGSVFEPGEGEGSDALRAVSPYGLSKGMTSSYFQYYCERAGVHFGKFVIPNPFGPYEEGRFTSYLAQSWLQGNTPVLNSPAYVRDNVPVSLLAKSYADFAAHLPDQPGHTQLNPSGYRESMEAFVHRFSTELSKRWDLPCPFSVEAQTQFPEPKERVNTDPLDTTELKWDEGHSWDATAQWYRETMTEDSGT